LSQDIDPRVEAVAKILAHWIRYDWDDLHNRDISAEFTDWAYNGIGDLHMQGGKPALRRVAQKMIAAYRDAAADGVQKPKSASAELIAYVEKIIKEYQEYIKATPGLLSLLYDIDLLPEQLLHVLCINPPAASPNASRMAAVCELWKRQIPAPPAAKEASDA
jgi:hypothetical protein